MKIKNFFVFLLCFVTFVVNAQNIKDVLLSEKTNSDIESYSVLPNVQTAMSNPDYLVTAGDVYSLNFAAGTTPVSYKIAVDSSYKIRVANLAVLDGKGKTFVALKNEIENIACMFRSDCFDMIVNTHERDIILSNYAKEKDINRYVDKYLF